jgi:hypothetical protein
LACAHVGVAIELAPGDVEAMLPERRERERRDAPSASGRETTAHTLSLALIPEATIELQLDSHRLPRHDVGGNRGDPRQRLDDRPA